MNTYLFILRYLKLDIQTKKAKDTKQKQMWCTRWDLVVNRRLYYHSLLCVLRPILPESQDIFFLYLFSKMLDKTWSYKISKISLILYPLTLNKKYLFQKSRWKCNLHQNNICWKTFLQKIFLFIFWHFPCFKWTKRILW